MKEQWTDGKEGEREEWPATGPEEAEERDGAGKQLEEVVQGKRMTLLQALCEL